MHLPKHLLARIVSIPTLLLGAVYSFAEEAPPTPAMVEAFFCTYQDGKDRDDLIDARDYLLKQSAKGKFGTTPSFVWHRFKGASPADFVWMSVHENPQAYGKAIDERENNADWEAALGRFEDMSNCTSNVGLLRVVVASDVQFTPPTYLATHGCNFKDDVSVADLGDLAGHIRGVWSGFDTLKDAPFYTIEPMTGDNPPDRVLMTVHESATDWAEDMGALVESDEGQQLFRHMDKLMQCNSAHWLAEQVVPAS